MIGHRILTALRARLARPEAIRPPTNGAPADHADRLNAIEQRLQDLNAGHDAHLQALTRATGAVEQAIEGIIAGHGDHLRALGRQLAATNQVVSSLTHTHLMPSPELQALGPAAQLSDPDVMRDRMLLVWTVMRWLTLAPVESDTLISVIVPTRNRRDYLARAIASVLSQRHTALELIVVDDGSTDGTGELLASIADPRFRSMRTTGIGASAARNLGLDVVSGSLVTHLDDDNLMDPLWLRGVAWGFQRWPDTELLYGARIMEDATAANQIPSGAMPELRWRPFDRARLEHSNFMDMNVIAHRAGLKNARFDPEIRGSVEWGMVLRLTAHRAPLELPVIACMYSAYAPDRLSQNEVMRADIRRIRASVHTTRPMRVLSFNSLFPLLSETYIEEEMLALEAAGARIAFAPSITPVSPYQVRQPVYDGLDEGIAAHDPDVVIVYWASYANDELDHLTRAGRPFALRTHSFDFHQATIKRISDHPLCVGVWAFPHHAAVTPGAHALAPLFTTHTAMPEPAASRGVIASLSAALPKKNWPLLLDALDQLSEFERVIAVARTNGHESEPETVERLAASYPRPPSIRIDVPRSEVFSLLARTSVVLYTKYPVGPFGMPMSVVEGMRAGACVVTPDCPEMRALCGDGFRPYTTAADIVAHVRAIMAGGPDIEAERRRNRDHALRRFCDPGLGECFHRELSAALTDWRARSQVV